MEGLGQIKREHEGGVGAVVGAEGREWNRASERDREGVEQSKRAEAAVVEDGDEWME